MSYTDSLAVQVCADHAGLEDVPPSTIPTRPCLLHLAFNSLRGLRFLSSEAKVIGLDVTSNRLVTLADASCLRAPSLQWLDVTDNFISSATLRNCPPMAPLLYALSLAGNSLQGFEPPAGLPFLHWLDLSRNPLRAMVCRSTDASSVGMIVPAERHRANSCFGVYFPFSLAAHFD